MTHDTDHTAKAAALAQKIEARATEIARNVRLEVSLNCGAKPEFMAIMLEAVERKIMVMRHAEQRKAVGK